jgi:ribonuclease HII
MRRTRTSVLLTRQHLAGCSRSSTISHVGQNPVATANPAPTDPMWSLEGTLWVHGSRLIAGVDEAGRGAWAGPVAVAAVILAFDGLPRAYRDSKTLSSTARERLAPQIQLEAVAWALEFAESTEVDEFGVLEATKRAALRAISKLDPAPDGLVTDYLKLSTPLPILSPPRADGSSYSVAAASILAKTTRDARMRELEIAFPGYGFGAHKGYGAKTHRDALENLGACPEHRKSFAPMALIESGLFSGRKT